MGDEEIMEYAKILREYCSNNTIEDCFTGKCPFRDETNKRCALNDEPVDWTIE